MKKRSFSVILAIMLFLSISISVFSYTDEQLEAADLFYGHGLFLGRSTTSKVYDLDSGLTRAECVALIVRMLGKEEEAKKADLSMNPFRDVSGWYTPYIVYAWQNGIANGRTEDLFDPMGEISDNVLYTFALRALGYSDQNDRDFNWENPYALALNSEIVDRLEIDATVTRGEAILMLWRGQQIFAESNRSDDTNIPEKNDAEKQETTEEKIKKEEQPVDNTGDFDESGNRGEDELPIG